MLTIKSVVTGRVLNASGAARTIYSVFSWYRLRNVPRTL